MKVTINSGNFAVVVSGIVKDLMDVSGKAADLVECGITYILQRDGMSAAYKAIIPKGAGTKRGEVAYSADNGAAIQLAVEKALEAYGEFAVEVGEYIPTTPQEMKDAVTKAEDMIKRGVAVNNAIKIAERCGYEVENPTNAKSLAKGIVKLNKFLVEAAKRASGLD